MTLPPPRVLRSHNLPADKQQALLELFPEICTEGGKIDFDRLKLAFGETVDTRCERYGLTWPGNSDCFKTIQAQAPGRCCHAWKKASTSTRPKT
jgi:adenine-specific DNA-methyltransferase